MADETVSTAAQGKENTFDASKLKVRDIDWYRLHSLAITHRNDKNAILGALETEIDACLESMQDPAQWKKAVLLARTQKYLELYGHWALEEALQEYIQKGTHL